MATLTDVERIARFHPVIQKLNANALHRVIGMAILDIEADHMPDTIVAPFDNALDIIVGPGAIQVTNPRDTADMIANYEKVLKARDWSTINDCLLALNRRLDRGVTIILPKSSPWPEPLQGKTLTLTAKEIEMHTEANGKTILLR